VIDFAVGAALQIGIGTNPVALRMVFPFAVFDAAPARRAGGTCSAASLPAWSAWPPRRHWACDWLLERRGSRRLLVAIFAVPVSMAVAILKYRLYDIDRIISRTPAYAIVTGLLVRVYAGLVVLATEVFRFRTPVAVAASTLAAAASFNPLRRRVQLSVDQWFNRPGTTPTRP
jgi:hypothetical protein